MENVGIFLAIWNTYLKVVWYTLWPFAIFSGHLVYFFPDLVHCSKKYLATLLHTLVICNQLFETSLPGSKLAETCVWFTFR
jgi:hypothetical protein